MYIYIYIYIYIISFFNVEGKNKPQQCDFGYPWCVLKMCRSGSMLLSVLQLDFLSWTLLYVWSQKNLIDTMYTYYSYIVSTSHWLDTSTLDTIFLFIDTPCISLMMRITNGGKRLDKNLHSPPTNNSNPAGNYNCLFACNFCLLAVSIFTDWSIVTFL